MRKLKRYLFSACCMLSVSIQAQKFQHDWENYVVSLNGRPVSINVDLGLKPNVPVLDLPYVIIARVKLNHANEWGMPDQEEIEVLDKLEEKMVENLTRYQGAVFVGRFTQRGIREFYFYSSDTTKYQFSIGNVLQESSTYQWLAQAKRDAEWENYLSVLFPSALDLLLIESRRKADENVKKNPTASQVSVLHYFEFQQEAAVKKFLQSPVCAQYNVNQLLKNAPSSSISLLLAAKATVNRKWVESTIPVLFSESKKHGGLYKGWEIGQ